MRLNKTFFFISISIISFGCQPALVNNTPQNYEIEFCKLYSEVWATTRDVFLAHEYQLLLSHKDDGFIRTEWRYSDYPSLGVFIRSRFNANFLPGRNVVRITPDVEFLSGQPLSHKALPIVKDVLREVDERLRCIGDVSTTIVNPTPPAVK